MFRLVLFLVILKGGIGCPNKPVNGSALKNLINCFAWYRHHPATNNNSMIQGCREENIMHCKLNGFKKNTYCRFDGSNILEETTDKPPCYFNCDMETCDAWEWGVTPRQMECIKDLNKCD